MKKKSMVFKMLCLALAIAFGFSVMTALAEEIAEVEDVVEDEVTTDVPEEVEDVTDAEEVTDEIVEEVTEEATETEEPATEAPDEEVEDEIEEEEVLDLFAATLRDGGVYVTPGENNAAVFTYDNLRYKVEAGMGNAIKLDGFEESPLIKNEPISDIAKNILQANGEIKTSAAHSGYFGLSVSAGDVVYRAGVTGNQIYVFSAWVRMPRGGSISGDDRAFEVLILNAKGEAVINKYVVGWNEIGREVEATGEWQQILFTFKAPENGLFAIDFKYNGREAMAIDDIELYEAELFDNPLAVTSVTCIDADGNEFNYADGFTTSGTIEHKTTLYNSDEDDVNFTAVAVLYKNDIMIDFVTASEQALVLDETEVTLEIEIPEDEDLSQYKYMVYFVSDTSPTAYYGGVRHRVANPYIVEGK